MTEAEKKGKQIIIRVEPAVFAFYEAEAKRRHVSISVVVRELLYADLEKRGVKTNGEL